MGFSITNIFTTAILKLIYLCFKIAYKDIPNLGLILNFLKEFSIFDIKNNHEVPGIKHG